jgi:hypothetical protein
MDKYFLDASHAGGYGSIKKLKKASKASYKNVRKYLESTEVYNRTKPVRRIFKRLKVVARHAAEIFQLDLFDNSKLSRSNRGYKFILLCTDTLSKRLYLIPLKSKSGPDVSKGLQRLVHNEPRIRYFFNDRGREFYNKHVTRDILEPNNIKMYSTYSSLKAVQAERLGRHVREKLQRHYLNTGQYNWIDVLDSIESVYNETPHSRTLLKPNDVNESNEMDVVERLFPTLPNERPKYGIGQLVRILQNINLFSKRTDAQWSTEIFEIYKINLGNPTTYMLRDSNNEIILGTVYFEELSPVTNLKLPIKIKIQGYKNVRHRRYVNILTVGTTKSRWTPLIKFNKELREGLIQVSRL